jgi:hypothetical protein
MSQIGNMIYTLLARPGQWAALTRSLQLAGSRVSRRKTSSLRG